MAEAFGIACHELVSLDFCCGSDIAVNGQGKLGPLLRVKQTQIGAN
jgi:hypothetical protein